MTGVVTLVVGGRPYAGWHNVTVQRAVGTGAGSFALDVSEAWATGQGPGIAAPFWSAFRIRPGDLVEVRYSGALVLTGIVDSYQPSYNARAHGVRISGRSKTRDLVDSSAVLKPKGELKKPKLEKVASALLEEYGDIKLELAADTGEPFDWARVITGETVHEMLERYGRQRGVYATDTPEGNLKLLQVEDGGPVATLREGVNILEARANLTANKKHSKYTAKGQEPGTDQKHGRKVAEEKAEATDTSVDRHRPLVLIAEGAAPKKTQQTRADFEAATRGGESVNATVTVLDWFAAPGKLWEPGDIVAVESPMLAVSRNLAVKSLTFRQSGKSGTLTELQLVPPEALNPKTKGGKGKSGGGAKPKGGDPAPAPDRGGSDNWWIFSKPSKGAV